MRIAHIAPPWMSIPPEHYGGTENVICTLVEEQIAQGHEVTLFAPGDARTSAKQISFSRARFLRMVSRGRRISRRITICTNQ